MVWVGNCNRSNTGTIAVHSWSFFLIKYKNLIRLKKETVTDWEKERIKLMIFSHLFATGYKIIYSFWRHRNVTSVDQTVSRSSSPFRDVMSVFPSYVKYIVMNLNTRQRLFKTGVAAFFLEDTVHYKNACWMFNSVFVLFYLTNANQCYY